MRERHPAIPGGLALSLLLAYGLLLSSVQANFLFTEEPLARSSPAAGDPDLFGYATALHRVVVSSDPQDFDHAIQNTWIIVGAPNGTYPGALPVFGNGSNAVNNTGLVYQCPVTPGPCGPVQGNGTGNDIRFFDPEGNSRQQVGAESQQSENKEGQFMGATITSTGYHILICSPRWISLRTRGGLDFDKTRGHGRCFIAGREMMNFTLLRPCTGGTPSSEGESSYCMAGTSAVLMDNNSTSDFSAFLGGPPFSSSRGGVFDCDLETCNSMNPFSLPSDSLYGGFAVDLGKITSRDELSLVSSHPKSSNYKGSVVVFNISTMENEAEVNGTQFGEYFGWTVATADLNGDGYDEVIVGAPLFSTPDRLEKGRIFIYRNNGTLDKENPTILPGTENKGRFGSAIVNLGDINSDGFEDIAVSAPFVAHEGGAEGTVYIYLGSGGDTIIDTTAVENITALQISQTLGYDVSQYLKTFGYSLSSGVDADANFYNDLVIGGYKGQTIIILRTQSIANISLSLATDPERLFDYTQRTCTVGPDRFACFNLMITASFSGRGLDGRALDTKVNGTEKTVSARRRLFFLNSGGDRTDTFEGFLNFSTTDFPSIQSITVYVENDITDRRTPLSLVVAVASLERVPREVDGNQSIIDLRDIPLLNVLPQNNEVVELTLAGCAIPDMCRPDVELTLKKTRYLNRDSFDSITIKASRDEEIVEVTLNYRTNTDDASDSFLTVDFDSDVFGAPSTPFSGNETCERLSDDQYKCFVAEIFSEYEDTFSVTVTLPVSQSLLGNEVNTVLSFTLVPGTDTDPMPGNNMVDIAVDIVAENNVTIQGLTINPEVTQYTHTDEIGEQKLSTRITLIGTGPSTIPKSILTVLIPGKTEETGEFYYLYPTGFTFSTMQEMVEVTCSELNPDKLQQFINQQKRRRRKRQTSSPSVMESVWRVMRGSEDERETVHKRQEGINSIDCSETPNMCTPITCNITGFGTGSLIVTITTVVDNRFFRTQSKDFTFFMSANYRIESTFFPVSSTQSVKSNKLEVTGPQEVVKDAIPIYVYVISIIIAIVIITLFIIALFLLVICLRRRTKKKIRRATERRRSRHGTAVAGTTGGAVVASLDTKPEGGVAEGEEEKPKPPPEGEDTPDKPTMAGETGPEDPDETEL